MNKIFTLSLLAIVPLGAIAQTFASGSLIANEFRFHGVDTAGTGWVVPTRYVFDLNFAAAAHPSADSDLLLFDSELDVLGYCDNQSSTDWSSRIIFDHFDQSGLSNGWGVRARNIGWPTFGYTISVTQSLTPVTDTGSLANGSFNTVSGVATQPGPVWFRVSVETTDLFVIDTTAMGPDVDLTVYNSFGTTIGGSRDSVYALEDVVQGDYFVSIARSGSFMNWDTINDQAIGWDREGMSGKFEGSYRVTFGAVPEPTTMAALGLGLAAFARRRRAK